MSKLGVDSVSNEQMAWGEPCRAWELQLSGGATWATT